MSFAVVHVWDPVCVHTLEDRGCQEGEGSPKGKNTKKQVVTCAEHGANFSLEEAPNVKVTFRRGKECFSVKLFSSLCPL